MMNYRVTTPTQIIFVRRDAENRFIVELEEINIIMKEGLQTQIIKKKNVEVKLENLVAGRIDVVDDQTQPKISNSKEEMFSPDSPPVLKVIATDKAQTKDKFG